MLPHEMQALMAKVLFFIFAIIMLAMTNVRADLIPTKSFSTATQVQVIQIKQIISFANAVNQKYLQTIPN